MGAKLLVKMRADWGSGLMQVVFSVTLGLLLRIGGGGPRSTALGGSWEGGGFLVREIGVS